MTGHDHWSGSAKGKTLWQLVRDREMVATQEEMNEARLPIEYRDYCAHILIPFNQCRRETSYMPWKCQDLRHLYEKCQFYDYEVRRRELAKQAANA